MSSSSQDLFPTSQEQVDRTGPTMRGQNGNANGINNPSSGKISQAVRN